MAFDQSTKGNFVGEIIQYLYNIFLADRSSMIQQIAPAMSVFGQALDALTNAQEFNEAQKISIVQSNVTCSDRGEVQWDQGEVLFKYLKAVSVPKKEGGPPLEFNKDGSLKTVEIRIVNLQMDVEASKTAQASVKKWEEIGVWQASKQANKVENGIYQGHGEWLI